jgi:lysozyme
MTRRISQSGLDLICQWEGLYLTAYHGAADRPGLLTIGYGHTDAAGPPKVTAGMTITKQQARDILRADLAKVEAAVESLVKVPLNDNQHAVLVSFAFNVGAGALAGSTLLRKLNSGDYDAVPAELMKWVNANGKRVQGLANRRAAEAGLWVRGAPVASQYVEPTVEKKNAALTPEAIAGGAGAVSGVVSAVSGATGPIAYALAAVIVFGFAIAAFYFIKRMREASQ